jgi:outer membrane protein assembly factor BamB
VLYSNRGGAPTAHTPTPTPTPPTKDPRLQWSFPADDKIVSSPIVAGGVVYTASNVGTIYALDAAAGTTLWSQPLRTTVHDDMAFANGLLYLRAGENLLALDVAAKGEIRLHTGIAFITEPAIDGGRLYAGQAGFDEIDSFDPQTFAHLWGAFITGSPSSAPAVVGDIAYVATDQSYLEAYSAAKAETLIWHRKLGGPVLHSKPVVANGVVYIGCDDHRFYAFDAQTGADRWSKPFETGGVIEATALVSDGTVYIGSGDGVLYALDAANGKLRWSYKTGAPIFNVAPVLDAGVLYVASEDHHVYALDPANGKVLRSYECAGPILVTPTIVDGTLYVGDLANFVYAFHLA